MTVYDERPWLALYDEGVPTDIELEYRNALEMFKASVSRSSTASRSDVATRWMMTSLSPVD